MLNECLLNCCFREGDRGDDVGTVLSCYVSRECKPLVILLFSSWLRSGVCTLANGQFLWTESTELVVRTSLWRKHPSLWSGISHRDSSIFCFRAWKKLRNSKSVRLFVNQKLLKRPFLACPGSLGLLGWQDPSQYPSATVRTVKRLLQNMKYLQKEQGPCVTLEKSRWWVTLSWSLSGG